SAQHSIRMNHSQTMESEKLITSEKISSGPRSDFFTESELIYDVNLVESELTVDSI
ncbi:MAG: hypothetical protein MHPSP_004665, partial [Paramarteilia canceri]